MYIILPLGRLGEDLVIYLHSTSLWRPCGRPLNLLIPLIQRICREKEYENKKCKKKSKEEYYRKMMQECEVKNKILATRKNNAKKT